MGFVENDPRRALEEINTKSAALISQKEISILTTSHYIDIADATDTTNTLKIQATKAINDNLMRYRCVLTQVGTNSPSATIFSTVMPLSANHGMITWSRTGVGKYIGDSPGNFSHEFIWCQISQQHVGKAGGCFVGIKKLNTNQILVESWVATSAAYLDGALSGNFVEILVPNENVGTTGYGPTSFVTAPIISNVTTSSPTASAVTITWQTVNVNANGAVFYGTTTAYGSTAYPSGGLSYYTNYQGMSISGLSSGTTYRFSILAKSQAGASTLSGSWTFVPS